MGYCIPVSDPREPNVKNNNIGLIVIAILHAKTKDAELYF